MHTRSPLEEANRGECVDSGNIRPNNCKAEPRAGCGAAGLNVAKVPWPLCHTARGNALVPQGDSRNQRGAATRINHTNTPADPSWPTTCSGDVTADPEGEVVYTVLAQDGSGHADRPPFDVASRLEAAVTPRMPGVKDAAALLIECLADVEDLLRLWVCR